MADGEAGIWEDFFLSDLFDVLDFASTANDLPKKELAVTRIEIVCSVLRQLLPLTRDHGQLFINDLLTHFEEISSAFIAEISNNTQWFLPSRVSNISFTNTFEYSSRRGRPRIYIPPTSLLYLRESGFSWNQIAEMFLVSKWTILRRATEYNLHEVVRFSDITDNELDRLVSEFFQEHSNFVGFSLIYGYLKSIGINVQHHRLKRSIREVDPCNSRLRYALVISRRVYNVRGPNSLWHVDGHHSLVTWGFVIHGGIDGFSRMIVFLHCSTNNRSETVFELFQDASNHYGVPSRVRSDHGGENILIWHHMEAVRGHNRGSAIRGTSTQNQRIERLWRDVFRAVCVNFYYLFHTLEIDGILDRNNNIHMFVLHYVFLPRINRSINSFCAAWNDHPLRTEHNWSPNRIWLNGNINVRNRYLSTVQDFLNNDPNISVDDLEWYGYDPGAPSPDDEVPQVFVEDIQDVPSNVLAGVQTIDPLATSELMGIDIYSNCLQQIELTL